MEEEAIEKARLVFQLAPSSCARGIIYALLQVDGSPSR